MWIIWSQIASALAYLHYGLQEVREFGKNQFIFQHEWQAILHRDIKPSNSKMHVTLPPKHIVLTYEYF
jgi:serine/threonine protein kinase